MKRPAAPDPLDSTPESAFVDEAPFVNERRPKRQRARVTSKSEEARIPINRTALTEECAAILSFGFWSAAFVTKHDFWMLDPREADEAAKALSSTIPTLPEKQAQRLARNLPGARLLIVFGSILGSRIYREYESRLPAAQRVDSLADRRQGAGSSLREPPRAGNGTAAPTAPAGNMPGESTLQHNRHIDDTLAANEAPPRGGSIHFEIPGIGA